MGPRFWADKDKLENDGGFQNVGIFPSYLARRKPALQGTLVERFRVLDSRNAGISSRR